MTEPTSAPQPEEASASTPVSVPAAAAQPASRKQQASLFARILNALIWAVVAVVVVILTLVVFIPKAMGWVPLTVLTGSMTPTIPIGSQVIVERVNNNADMKQLQVGDVISFLPFADDGTVVTHRIISIGGSSNGDVVVTTQGDANDTPDEWALTAKQVRGVMKYHVPYVGYAATALTQEKKDTGIWIAAGGLFLYASYQLIGAFVRRKKGTDRPMSSETNKNQRGKRAAR